MPFAELEHPRAIDGSFTQKRQRASEVTFAGASSVGTDVVAVRRTVIWGSLGKPPRLAWEAVSSDGSAVEIPNAQAAALKAPDITDPLVPAAFRASRARVVLERATENRSRLSGRVDRARFRELRAKEDRAAAAWLSAERSRAAIAAATARDRLVALHNAGIPFTEAFEAEQDAIREADLAGVPHLPLPERLAIARAELETARAESDAAEIRFDSWHTEQNERARADGWLVKP